MRIAVVSIVARYIYERPRVNVNAGDTRAGGVKKS